MLALSFGIGIDIGISLGIHVNEVPGEGSPPTSSTATRGFFERTLVSLGLTLWAVVFVVLSFALLAALPPLLGALGLGQFTELVLSAGRWPVLAGGMVRFLALLFRYGPPRRAPK